MLPIRIISTGKYLPRRIVTAEELDARMGVDPGWSARITGVTYRHYVDGETSSQMGAIAAKEALQKAGLTFRDIDALVSTSATLEQALPCNAALIQEALGEQESAGTCFDVNATCISFLMGMDVLSYMMAAGRYRRVLFVASEIASVGLNPKHPEACALFGDGAVAVIAERSEGDASGILSARFETYSSGAHACEIPGGGTGIPDTTRLRSRPVLLPDERPKGIRARLAGDQQVVERLTAKTQHTLRDMKLVIPHQASMPALLLMRRKLKLRPDQWYIFVEGHGNTIAASLPMGLHNAIEAGKIQRGDVFTMIGTAGGFTIGGMVFKY